MGIEHDVDSQTQELCKHRGRPVAEPRVILHAVLFNEHILMSVQCGLEEASGFNVLRYFHQLVFNTFPPSASFYTKRVLWPTEYIALFDDSLHIQEDLLDSTD